MSKKPSLFSQYSRAPETNVFVSQVIVMLSSMSSFVRPSLCAVEHARDQPVAALIVVEEIRRQPDGRIRLPVHRLRPQAHLVPVADALRADETAGDPRPPVPPATVPRAAVPPLASAFETSGGTTPAMLVWMPSNPGGACAPMILGDDRAPVAALRDVLVVAQPLHQHVPGLRDVRSGPSRSCSAVPRIRSRASTESRHGRRRRPFRRAPSDRSTAR